MPQGPTIALEQVGRVDECLYGRGARGGGRLGGRSSPGAGCRAFQLPHRRLSARGDASWRPRDGNLTTVQCAAWTCATASSCMLQPMRPPGRMQARLA